MAPHCRYLSADEPPFYIITFKLDRFCCSFRTTGNGDGIAAIAFIVSGPTNDSQGSQFQGQRPGRKQTDTAFFLSRNSPSSVAPDANKPLRQNPAEEQLQYTKGLKFKGANGAELNHHLCD